MNFISNLIGEITDVRHFDHIYEFVIILIGAV